MFFFFKQKTAYEMRISDWSSDVCSSDLFASDEAVAPVAPVLMPGSEFHRLWGGDEAPRFPDAGDQPAAGSYFPPVGGFRFGLFTLPPARSEERRVGKECVSTCRSRWSPDP